MKIKSYLCILGRDHQIWKPLTFRKQTKPMLDDYKYGLGLMFGLCLILCLDMSEYCTKTVHKINIFLPRSQCGPLSHWFIQCQRHNIRSDTEKYKYIYQVIFQKCSQKFHQLPKISLNVSVSHNLSKQHPLLFKSPPNYCKSLCMSLPVPMKIKGICVDCPFTCTYIGRSAEIHCIVIRFHHLQVTGSIVTIKKKKDLLIQFVLQMKAAGCKVSQDRKFSRRRRTDAQGDTGFQTLQHSPRPKKEIQ